ncbi:sugar ABC transporter substrate-binding protein [Nocardioides flavescens]|uniref:Substrate-binding domain-containing protein n=1 Tax=Nocardioides flavescens TaxID=2691959 RepID=A0A6L7ELW5_9ACTN|nr:substrate-binding domain-containing protein [Nocardioides flavescens]MXG88293.1 substrate-binding domain-containing protein [Nocardioides flavescens]
MRHTSMPALRGVALVGVVLGTMLAAGCSSGSSEAGDTGAAAATSDEAKQALEAAYAGDTGTPPTVATTPKSGVNAWVISCGEQVPSCATPTAGIVEAAEAVGWTAKVCDGQLNPDGWATCVDQATTAGADVVFPVGIDCASIQEPFTQAKAAGVAIVGAGGADCAATGGESVFDSERLQLPDTTIEEYWKKAGATVADYLIGSTDAKAKVIEYKFTSPLWGPWLSEGFETQLATCGDCEIVGSVDISNDDFAGTAAVDKFAAGLQKYPDANAVYVPVGGWMPTGFGAAVKASGRDQDLVVASGFGDAAAMDLIRDDGGLDAALGYATEWGSYGSVDTAIRVLNGEEPQVEGDGFQVVDADHNMPASGDYVGGDVDFKAEYLKLWGVS